MEIQYYCPRKTHNFGVNFNNELGIFFDSLLRYANAKACETFGFDQYKDDPPAAITLAERTGRLAEFIATYSSILKKESERSQLVKAVLLAAEKKQSRPSGLEDLTSTKLKTDVIC